MKVELWQAALAVVTFCMPALLAVRKLLVARIELAQVRTEAAIKVASAEGVAVAEMRATKLKLSGIHVTPVAMLAMARDAQLAKLAANPAIDEKKIPDLTLTNAIEESHASAKEAVRVSSAPPAGSTMPAFSVPPRSPTGFSSDKLKAVKPDQLPDLARPSGAPSGLDMDVTESDEPPTKPTGRPL